MIIKKGYRHDLITFFISTDELMTAMQVNYSIAFFSTSQHKKLADLKCNLIGVSFFKSVSGIISRTVMAIRVSWFSEEIPIIQQPATRLLVGYGAFILWLSGSASLAWIFRTLQLHPPNATDGTFPFTAGPFAFARLIFYAIYLIRGYKFFFNTENRR